ncbi:gamma-glutamylcyclotransferase-like [Bradysia coprophila]|uniref:gamma-glutamylcyclotransferase-like n=1 Tax=Bradysia coprophila TaxID=38358 RepID=UPI00187D9F58|nr:gamma-glutamylcyclotransferase-like [Bradysia coprophila]
MTFLRWLILLVSGLVAISTIADSAVITLDNSIPSLNGTFMYFAYGSNLLSNRIHYQNPTAERRTTGRLENYRLDFNVQSRNWNGAGATIVEDDDYHVYGAIWEIDISNLDELDRQEGVDQNLYRPLTKSIITPTGGQIDCRVYQQIKYPDVFYELEDLPVDRQPSRSYLNCILKGAYESQLPIEYIYDLWKIPHNNQDANNLSFRQLCD